MSEEVVVQTIHTGSGETRTVDEIEDVSARAAIDGQAHTHAFVGQPAHNGHIVQFYETESSLVDHAVRFILSGLRGTDPVIIIATPRHRAAFVERLIDDGIDVERVRASGQCVMLDARETLAGFMVGDMPDWEKFRNTIGSVLENRRAGAGCAHVRVYSEMIDLLWHEGNHAAAIHLEGFWIDLQQHYSFLLLCAYVMGNVHCPGGVTSSAHSCKTHTSVLAAGGYSNGGVGDPAPRAAVLQHRVRSLEAKIAHCKELESTLRDALARGRAARQESERNIRYKPARSAPRSEPGAERMSRMIAQIVDFTRIRVGGGLQLNRRRIDLAAVCDRVKDELKAGNPHCSITLETHGNTSGVWDPDRLVQAFSNIIGNAVFHGGPACRVSLHADGSDELGVIAQVHNDGTIPPEMLPTIFEPFRGRNKPHEPRGSGLGLFITRQIILGHGGTISLTSNEVEGTTVRVTLPRVPIPQGTQKLEP